LINSFACSNEILCSSSQDRKIKIWNINTQECVATFDHATCSLIIYDDKLYSGSHSGGGIKVWDLKTNTYITELNEHSDSVNSLIVHNGRLISGSTDNTIKIWDLKTNTCQATLNGHTESEGITSLAAFDEMLIAGYRDNTIAIWNLKTNTCQTTLSGHTEKHWHGGIDSLIVFKDKLISSANGQNPIKIWDLKTNTFIGRLEHGANYAGRLVFSNGMLCRCDKTGISILDFKADHITIFDELANLLELAYLHNFPTEQDALSRFSRMPKAAKNAIYAELYKVLKPLDHFTNDYWGCAEHAFHGLHEQSSTLAQKVQAIRNYVKEQDNHSLLQHLGIVSSKDYSEKLACRPHHLQKIGIRSAEDLQLICSLSSGIQVLEIEKDSGVGENFRDTGAQRKAHQRQAALSDLSDQMSQAVTIKIQETNTCGSLLYERVCPWIGFQNRLNAFRSKFDAIALECNGLPKLIVEAFKTAKYNELANELNALVGEFQILDRDHQIIKLHTYINQWGILNAWKNRQDRGIQSLENLPLSEQTLQKLFQMGE
jgi:WD40 repeat protein